METSTSRRKMISIALGGALLVIIATLTTLNNNLRFVNPSTTEEIFVFTGLSAVVFLVFVAVLVLLVRNVLKLYADQKSRVMGTRLRTRMLWGAVLVSLLPIAFMSLFNFVLMNRAVDHWFSKPVTEMRDDSNQMALELSRYTTSNARAEADSIAASLSSELGARDARSGEREAAPSDRILSDRILSDRVLSDRVLRQHEITLQGGFALVYQDGSVVAGFHVPGENGEAGEVKSWIAPGSGATDEDETGRGRRSHGRRGTAVRTGRGQCGRGQCRRGQCRRGEDRRSEAAGGCGVRIHSGDGAALRRAALQPGQDRLRAGHGGDEAGADDRRRAADALRHGGDGGAAAGGRRQLLDPLPRPAADPQRLHAASADDDLPGTVRVELAGAAPLKAGDAAGGGAGRRDGPDIDRRLRTSRRGERDRGAGRAGAQLQPHGGGP